MSKIQSHISNCFIPFCEPQDVMHQGFVAWAEKEYKEKKKKDIINNDMDIIKLPKLPSHIDERGEIQQIVNNIPFSSVLRITSKAGSVRANHFHINDMHVCLLIFGKMNYLERPVGSKEKPVKVEINSGDVFLTNKMIEHCMQFVEDSEFLCFAKLSRDQADYEKDTIQLGYNLVDL